MQTLLASSLVFLCILLAVRYAELARGMRYAEHARTRLDLATLGAKRRMRRALRTSGEYVRRDVVLRTLHMVTYTSLMLVRAVERKLTRITDFLRSFRRARLPRGTKGQLRDITRETPGRRDNTLTE